MAQIITAVQQKGGAGKSTMLSCLGGVLAKDGARVLVIDTDPQKSCVEWAQEQDLENLDVLEHLSEDTLLDVIDKVDTSYDTILIDTAGYDSRMATYAIQVSDLILIPCRGSKKDVMGGARTWKHAVTLTKRNKDAPEIRIVLWNVNTKTNVFEHTRRALKEAKLPLLDGAVPTLTGFDVMSWNGGLPGGTASRALNEFIGTLQINDMIKFYTDRRVIDGKAA